MATQYGSKMVARAALLGVLQARARSLAAQTCRADASSTRPKMRIGIKVGHVEMSYEAELGSGEVDRLLVETTAAVFKELAINSCQQERVFTACPGGKTKDSEVK